MSDIENHASLRNRSRSSPDKLVIGMSSVRHGLLPCEVVEDILSWLPVESLLRFKCVSKSWLSLIGKPSFVLLHLSRYVKSHASTNNNNILLYNSKFNKLSSLSSDFSLKQIPIPLLESKGFDWISNSCNGIVCFYFRFNFLANEVALCNPATREFRFLPQSEMLSVSEHSETTWLPLSVGVGYDHETNDYRVVRMWNSHGVVEEYALSTDSWKIIGRDIQFAFHFAMFFKGVYYWWGKVANREEEEEGEEGSTTVFTLKVGGGAFQEVCMPQSKAISNLRCRHLCVLNEFVSLVLYNYCDESATLDIWVMDGADEGSWTKLRSVPINVPSYTFWNVFEPLGFWKGNELLTKRYEGPGKLEFFDIGTEEEFPRLSFEMFDGKQLIRNPSLEAITYVMSLVSIKGRN